MKRLPVTSNALRSVGYDEDQKHLEVEFHNGYRYRYERVPPGHWDNLINADSVGIYFNRNIRFNPIFIVRELGPDHDSIAKDEESGG